MFKPQTRNLLIVILFACSIGFPSVARAQAAVSFYHDVTPGESVVDVYVEMLDVSDMSQCNWQCYHYGYGSDVEIAGSQGSDSAGGYGLGPYYLQVPFIPQADDDIEIWGGIDFTCTWGGYLTAFLPPTLFLQLRGFNLHYHYVGFDVYQPNQNSSHRLCAAAPVIWEQGGGTQNMTMFGTGFAFGLVNRPGFVGGRLV